MAFHDGGGGERIEPRLDSLGDPDEDVPLDDAKPRSGRSGKLLGALVALAGVAGFVAIAWYATNQGKKDSSTVVPVIRADKSPIKILPAKPGGTEVPNQDKLIFMQINPGQKQAKKERLLPPPEKPMPKPTPPPDAAQKAPSETTAEKPEALFSDSASPPPGRKPVRPEPVAPQANAQPEAAPGAPKTSMAADKPTKTGRAGKKTEVASVPAVKSVPPGPIGGAFIQLGAFRAEDIAAKAAKRIEARHKSLLAGLAVKAVRGDLGKRGVYYRLRAGPLADKAAAADLCEKLKARKQGCMIVKP